MPLIVGAVPFKMTVPVPALKVPPLLVQLPLTVKVLEPKFSVAPELMVIFLQRPGALKFTVAPVGIITSVVAVGGTPPHQLDPVFQSLLVYPNHDPAPEHDDVATLTIPVEATKYAELM